MLTGSCLCGAIRFEVHGEIGGISECHCSLCRKVSGTGCAATIPVAADQLVWLAGQELIQQYERPSGYGTSFCRICGSPAPDANRAGTRYGIPAGILADLDARVVEHIYVGSKAAWDVIGDTAPQFPEAGP